MCYGRWSSCSPFSLSYPYSPCDGHNPSQFAAIWLSLHHSRNYLLRGIVNICQHANVSCPAAALLSSQPWFIKWLPVSVLLSLSARSCGMRLLFCLGVPQQ
jgi:hypothetical protein